MRNHIKQDRVKQVLDYNPDTGEFRWKKTGKGRDLSRPAGTITKWGYVSIHIDKKKYFAHRLAWLYTYGTMPDIIDHIDLNGKNNRIENLRAASKTQNEANRKRSANNTSGYKGVYPRGNSGKWFSRIHVSNKMISLGTYDTPELAHKAYTEAAIKYFGDFARW
jgi:hypothetical protein